jgi:hypothetical protein
MSLAEKANVSEADHDRPVIRPQFSFVDGLQSCSNTFLVIFLGSLLAGLLNRSARDIWMNIVLIVLNLAYRLLATRYPAKKVKLLIWLGLVPFPIAIIINELLKAKR